MSIHTFHGDGNAWLRGEPSARTPDNWTVTYEGCVIQTFERNGYDDSDFMAIVWDDEAGAVKETCYATTRGWTYANGAEVDITPENMAKAQAWKRERMLRDARATSEARAKFPYVGREVRILPTATGRNRRTKAYGELPAGTTGYVCAIKQDSYSRSNSWVSPRYRVGLQYDNTIVYLPWDAVEVVDPEQYLLTDEEIDEMVPAAETIRNFHTAAPGYINMVGAA